MVVNDHYEYEPGPGLNRLCSNDEFLNLPSHEIKYFPSTFLESDSVTEPNRFNSVKSLYAPGPGSSFSMMLNQSAFDPNPFFS